MDPESMLLILGGAGAVAVVLLLWRPGQKKNKGVIGADVSARAAVAALLVSALGACTGMGEQAMARPSYGVVVVSRLAPGASDKVGVLGESDRGARLFAFSLLNAKGGDTASYGGAGMPTSVRVTWRRDVDAGKYWTSGTVIGDYVINVAERVPPAVLRYASGGRARALRLIFRIKDDGVLLAWDVQEAVTHPNGGSGFVFYMHGGDFPCETSPYQRTPNCTEGPLEKAPWYNPQWKRG